MIETPAAAARAQEIAAEADFLSIGTNDLVQYTLGLDRELPLASAQAAADPAVLALVEDVVEAAHARGISVEVCGEAAGEPPLVALLVGLGVDELSVAPARLDEVRSVVRGLSSDEAAATARAALEAGSAAEALALGAGLVSGEARDELGQARDSLGGVVA
jgi:phosphoenolpyruvate-protein kinase (PTS system EI component)